MIAVNGFHHLSLTVRDLPASVRWYTDLFGLQKMMDEPHEGGHAVVLFDPDRNLFIGLHAHDNNDGAGFDETRPGLDHLSFGVSTRDDLVSWQASLDEHGIQHGSISDQPWGSVMAFRDPDNIQLELCAPPTTS